ncbi:hypothetical protein LCGC14_2273280 [marine sediment metagenome]|uniref:Uncharacterized protein n=1 Tax=marine sediment metagenome TaxID=412755 RepID=A0A0F9CWH0_9ZZZZ
MVWRTEDGLRAGYTLRSVDGAKLRLLIADDPALAREVIATVKPTSLEHHPSGWLAREVLEPEWAIAEAKRSAAAMAIELREGVLDPVIDALDSNRRLPGFCNWPIPFMLC